MPLRSELLGGTTLPTIRFYYFFLDMVRCFSACTTILVSVAMPLRFLTALMYLLTFGMRACGGGEGSACVCSYST